MLDRAISMVGVTRVRSVLLAAALEGLHERKHSNFKGKTLWDHALAAGCISQYLALAHDGSDSEEALMAGLLHDIWRPILDQMLGDQYTQVIALVNDGVVASLLSAEQRVFGFDHTDIGFVAVNGCPRPIAEAIRFHHDPTMAEADRPLCATVSLANSMCAKAELGPDRQPVVELATLPSTEILGLATTVGELWEQVPRLVQHESGH
jgi:HD-like signal output (HDOD) protein